MQNHRAILDWLLLPLRPGRWAIFGFRFAWLPLLAAGVVAVVYGSAYHCIPVSETHTEQISIPDPNWKPPMMSDTLPGGLPGLPFQPPANFTPVKMLQLTKTVKTTSDEWELAVNRAVTVAGIVRNEHGELFRAAGANGGPGFCPS
jgi:hypothetical protein